MRSILLIALASTTAFLLGKTNSLEKTKVPIWGDTQHVVVGRLGEPMGDPIRITGVLQISRSKATFDQIEMKVENVNGKSTAGQEEMVILLKPYWGYSFDRLGKGDSNIPLEEGAKFQLLGFETGEFSGINRKAEDVNGKKEMDRAFWSYGFHSHFEVLSGK